MPKVHVRFALVPYTGQGGTSLLSQSILSSYNEKFAQTICLTVRLGEDTTQSLSRILAKPKAVLCQTTEQIATKLITRASVGEPES